MNLRYEEEESHRLSPDEARAFLQVHAEREAKAAELPPDAPTVEDLAESLHLPVEEARAILDEARRRIATKPVVEPKKKSFAGPIAATAILALLLFMGSLFSFRSGTAPVTAVMSVTPGLPMTAATPAVATPPDGFTIMASVPEASMEVSGNPAKFGTDYRRLSPSEAAALRTRLAEATLALLDGIGQDAEPWRNARNLAVRLRVTGGEPVTLYVPLKPFTLPLGGNPGGREDLRRSLEMIFATGWPSVQTSLPR